MTLSVLHTQSTPQMVIVTDLLREIVWGGKKREIIF